MRSHGEKLTAAFEKISGLLSILHCKPIKLSGADIPEAARVALGVYMPTEQLREGKPQFIQRVPVKSNGKPVTHRLAYHFISENEQGWCVSAVKEAANSDKDEDGKENEEHEEGEESDDEAEEEHKEHDAENKLGVDQTDDLRLLSNSEADLPHLITDITKW